MDVDQERIRWPGALVIGIAVAIVVAVVAWIFLEAAFALAVLLVMLVVIAAAVAARRVNRANPRADIDRDDPVPRQPPNRDRPLGDTREAHDEITPRDIPPDSPARPAAEDQAERESGDRGGTFRGDR